MNGGLAKLARVYRLVTPDHTCKYGLKSVELLKREGYSVEDHLLRNRADEDAFKAKHGVKTTPQTFIEGKRISGYVGVRRHLGLNGYDFHAMCERPPLVAMAVTVALILLAVSIVMSFAM